MCGAIELVGLIMYKLFRVMLQVGTLSWNLPSVYDEAMLRWLIPNVLLNREYSCSLRSEFHSTPFIRSPTNP